MPELERELRELGGTLEFPATPDVATAVRRRLAAAPEQRRLVTRRTLVLAFAVLAVAVGAVMAVPQARTAILEWLGLRGVTIERVPTTPTAPADAELGLGDRVTLEEARRRAGFAVLVPTLDELDEPREVYFSSATTGGQVGFVYRSGERVRILLTEFRGSLERQFVQKMVGPRTKVETLTVNGGFGVWLTGEPHEFFYLDETGEPVVETIRLAGNTLLWEQGDLTLRLEGDLTKDEALRIATSVR